ncbi:hypothetical protein CW697_11955 [Macrococcoides caseolyticum]|uniref:YopX family protein n=1 Tax=Macrococcoides caseolyticum TaxID=69966 RepID=UPI000C337474|nr:YopX family protein [Macrococcus caseolyticus]PKF28717.1 hypothetical protein CW697_11955 [Macrococcus caseolyticus]
MIPKYRMWLKCAELMQRVHSINFYQETAEWIFHDLVNQKEVIEEELFDNIILMQSTGLYDKKTKEIYYDDILKRDDGTLLVVDDVRTHSFLDLNMHLGYEVIGNIHEHPELLN